MSKASKSRLPFTVNDCAMLSIATGVEAFNLKELGSSIRTIPASSLYFHFWGAHLRPGFEEPEYNNDFALWAHHQLHDRRLAERLSIIDPPSFGDLEGLRRELLTIIQARLEESDATLLPTAVQGFHFIRAITLVFDSGLRIGRPEDLLPVLPNLSRGSLYYHFIDARRRPPEGIDDFRAWLMGFGDQYQGLIDRIADIDPYFVTLTQLHSRLESAFAQELSGVKR